MKRRLIVQVLLGALVLALGACRSSAASPRERGALRVVSLHDVTTELAVRLGARANLVGIAEPVDVPELVRGAVAGVPRVGGLETIRAARPDVVLGLRVVAERDPELMRGLDELGIPVRLWHPTKTEDVFALAAESGVALDVAAQGKQLAAELRARAAHVQRARAAARPRVFVYDCCDPPFTAGRSALLSALIAEAGGQNVFGELNADWAHVSWEAVFEREPELVVVHEYALEGQSDVQGKERALARFSRLAELPKVVLPLRWSLGGPGAIDALERLARAIDEVRR